MTSNDFLIYDTCFREHLGPDRPEKATGRLLAITEKETIQMLSRQLPVFNRLRNAWNFILNCPTGWGKSKMIQFLLLRDLVLHQERKAVIIIPQNMIAPGFVDGAKMKVPGCGEVSWGIHKNLCSQIQGKSGLLRDFLLSPRGKYPDDRTVVTSHSCFVKACAGLDLATVLANVTLVIDECHHVQTEGRGDQQFNNDMNQLGRIVHDLLKTPSTTTKLWLATATPGRGDGSIVIREEDLANFVVEQIQFDDFWKDMKYLKQFRNSFAIYRNGTQLKMLRSLVKQVKRTLVYCPPIRSQFLGQHSKAEFIRKTKEALLQTHPLAKEWAVGASTDVPGTTYIIDMTNEKNRDEKVTFLRKNGRLVYAVLAVGRMKEGADWPQLERIVDFCPSMSMTLRIQKFGRGTRDCPGKTRFEYFTCLPKISNKSPEVMRKACSEHFGQLIVSLIDAMYYYGEGRWIAADGDRLDNSAEIAIVRSAVQEIIGTLADTPDASEDEIREAISLGIEAQVSLSDEQRQKVTKAIYRALQRQAAANSPNWAKRPTASVVDNLGFDAVNATAKQIRDSIHTFCTGACGLKTFKDVRRLLDSERGATFRELVKQTNAWMARTGNTTILPLLEAE